jgi:hypothetical protein
MRLAVRLQPQFLRIGCTRQAAISSVPRFSSTRSVLPGGTFELSPDERAIRRDYVSDVFH